MAGGKGKGAKGLAYIVVEEKPHPNPPLKGEGTMPFKFFKDFFDLGDFIEVHGTLFKTKQDQKTLLVTILIQQIKTNGKVKFHDFFIKAFIGTVIIGIVAAVIITLLP